MNLRCTGDLQKPLAFPLFRLFSPALHMIVAAALVRIHCLSSRRVRDNPVASVGNSNWPAWILESGSIQPTALRSGAAIE